MVVRLLIESQYSFGTNENVFVVYYGHCQVLPAGIKWSCLLYSLIRQFQT